MTVDLTRSSLAALLILAAASPAAAQDRPAQSRTERCMGPSPTTADMLNCSGEEIARLEREMDGVYRDLVAKVPAKERRAFAQAQAAWSTYRTTSCRLWMRISEGGGSMYPVMASSCVQEVTVQRLKELRGLRAALM